MADIFGKIAAGKVAPIYILSSEHPLLIDRAVKAILDATLPPAMRGFNYDVIEARGAGANQILAAAQTLPMMAAKRMVLVRDLADLAAAELNKLLPYLDAPNPSTVLVGISSKADKRLKFYAGANKKKVLHVLTPPRDIAAWVRGEAKARNVQIAASACSRLVDAAGKDLSRLALAIDQLALYAGDREVRSDDVDDLIADTRERSVFELIDAIGRGDRVGALRAVSLLCEQRQSPIGVVVMLARHMRQLSLARVADSRRMPQAEAARVIGTRPFLVGKLLKESRRYSPAMLAKAEILLSNADRGLKGRDLSVKVLGRELGERVLLDRVVTELLDLTTRSR